MKIESHVINCSSEIKLLRFLDPSSIAPEYKSASLLQPYRVHCATYVIRRTGERQLLKPLRDIRQSDGERLQSAERILKIQRVRVAIYSPELHHLQLFDILFYAIRLESRRNAFLYKSYLSTPEFDLKILGAFLSYSATEIELVHLAGFVPHGRLILHHQLRVASYRFRFRTGNIRPSLLEL